MRYTYRSNRKRVMTNYWMHRNLTLQEENYQIRNTRSDMNNHVERYVDTTLEMNAPGSLAVAGYFDCHT